MGKTKFDFISDLLAGNKLNTFQKERFFALVVPELKKAGEVDEKILRDIEEIKYEILNKKSLNLEVKNEEKTEPLQNLQSDNAKLIEALKSKHSTFIYPIKYIIEAGKLSIGENNSIINLSKNIPNIYETTEELEDGTLFSLEYYSWIETGVLYVKLALEDTNFYKELSSDMKDYFLSYKFYINSHIKSQIKIHSPHETIKALRLFDTDLKYFTHKWDIEGEFNRVKEIEKGKKIIEGLDLPKPLWHRINIFITRDNDKKREEDKEWFVHYLFGRTFNCYYSWDNKKFIDWFENSISKDITAPIINDNMIEPFKHSIQIRDNRLIDHIRPLADKYLGNEFGIEYKNLEQAKFYTNVQELMRGIIAIFESIKKYAVANDRFKVRIEYLDKDTTRAIRITHIKSVCLLNSTNPDFIGGSFKSIAEKMFFSICNWSIEAKFADGSKRLNILSDIDNLEFIEDLVNEPEGFTHILYFY